MPINSQQINFWHCMEVCFSVGFILLNFGYCILLVRINVIHIYDADCSIVLRLPKCFFCANSLCVLCEQTVQLFIESNWSRARDLSKQNLCEVIIKCECYCQEKKLCHQNEFSLQLWYWVQLTAFGCAIYALFGKMRNKFGSILLLSNVNVRTAVNLMLVRRFWS